ncbi:MAG: aryl-sulfate sulfotransferase [Planctomycetota bacterium]
MRHPHTNRPLPLFYSLAFLLFPLANLSAQTSAQPAPQADIVFVREPTVRPNPIRRAPLVAIVEFETDVEVLVSVEVSDGQNRWKQPPITGPQKKHSIPVVGLRPGLRHAIRVLANKSGDTKITQSKALEFITEPLPNSFPPIRTILAKPEKMEPGVTFFAVNFWDNSTSMLDYGYIIAVDNRGDVVWFCHTTDRIADMRFTKAGNLLYQHGSYRYAYEIDLLGRDRRRWIATNLTKMPNDGLAINPSIPVEIDTIHHDLLEKNDGNFLTLATELRHFQQYPTSEFERDAPWEPAYVVCDRVIEFDPNNGKINNQLHLTNILDPNRFGYMALSGFWKDKYNQYINEERARDWSHANALVHLPEENAILVSFRHLDCIFKIDWETKKIKWILGNHDNWSKPWQKYLLKPVGDLQWFYHQHAPQMTTRGTLMMYDNGNYRASPFEKATFATENRSRVVEYKIDEDAMTVEQVYVYDGGENNPFYCPFYCEADLLPQTQNILVTDGGHIELADGTPDDNVPADRQWARIFEITGSENPERVFELNCMSPLGSRYGWSIYRSIRRPNLYENLNLVAPLESENDLLYPREQHIRREFPKNARF